MTRTELISRFREENPELTSRVFADSVLNSWLIAGNLEIACKARLIKGDTSFSSVAGTRSYDLTTQITNFYDIDDFPGGGVVYDNDPLELTSISELDTRRSSWRTEANGTPKKFWRWNQYLYLDKKPVSVKTIEVYSILFPGDFDTASETPFNELTHLEPFHYSLVLYMQKRAKAAVGKPEEAQAAEAEYGKYVTWMKNEVNRGIYSAIQFTPALGYIGGRATRRSRA